MKQDGSTIISKVLEVNKNEIKYKRFNNLNGPTYTIEKAENFTSTNSVGVKLYMKQLYGLKERMAVWSGSKDKSDLLKAIKEDIPDYDDYTIVGHWWVR